MATPYDYQRNSLYTIRSCYAVDEISSLAYICDAKLIQASTSEIYGNALECPQKETYFGNVNPIGPRSCYDEGKRLAETILYEKRKDVDCKIVRIFNTYGPYMREDDRRVIPTFIHKAVNNEPLPIFGDGNQVRSFLYIDDLLDGMIALSKLSGFEVINLGYPVGHTINELANLVNELCDNKLTMVKLDLPTDDPIKRIPDISKANKLIGFMPKINLKEGLVRTMIKYYVNS
jgi:UDP-glucuronate decarboxylase